MLNVLVLSLLVMMSSGATAQTIELLLLHNALQNLEQEAISKKERFIAELNAINTINKLRAWIDIYAPRPLSSFRDTLNFSFNYDTLQALNSVMKGMSEQETGRIIEAYVQVAARTCKKAEDNYLEAISNCEKQYALVKEIGAKSEIITSMIRLPGLKDLREEYDIYTGDLSTESLSVRLPSKLEDLLKPSFKDSFQKAIQILNKQINRYMDDSIAALVTPEAPVGNPQEIDECFQATLSALQELIKELQKGITIVIDGSSGKPIPTFLGQNLIAPLEEIHKSALEQFNKSFLQACEKIVTNKCKEMERLNLWAYLKSNFPQTATESFLKREEYLDNLLKSPIQDDAFNQRLCNAYKAMVEKSFFTFWEARQETILGIFSTGNNLKRFIEYFYGEMNYLSGNFRMIFYRSRVWVKEDNFWQLLCDPLSEIYTQGLTSIWQKLLSPTPSTSDIKTLWEKKKRAMNLEVWGIPALASLYQAVEKVFKKGLESYQKQSAPRSTSVPEFTYAGKRYTLQEMIKALDPKQNILKVDEVSSLTTHNINKQYRKIMVIVHPDKLPKHTTTTEAARKQATERTKELIAIKDYLLKHYAVVTSE